MIGVDTNVLLRHLLQDDPTQSPVASGFFAARSAGDPVFISQVVLAETVWTLRSRHDIDASRIAATVRALLGSADVVVESASTVRRALRDHEEAQADLADAIIARSATDVGCDGVVTFDERAWKLPGMLPVG